MKLDSRTIYAQSSDIKSRTYLEYRRDMKKKAIAELEILPWLNRKLQRLHPGQRVKVYKSGGDCFLWFLREGGITRKPDYIAEIDDKKLEVEFQYAGGGIQEDFIYDFKTSKVGKKVRGLDRRVPKNTIFLYLFKKAPTSYAFLPAQWILRNGRKGVAQAWGSREVYKITGKQMLTKVQDAPSLRPIWNRIEAKLAILDFQHEFIDMTKNRLSSLLQKVVDENKLVKIVPKDLDGFFKVCFILDNLGKFPQNANIWLVYLLSYITNTDTLEEITKIIYSLDFLYSKTKLKKNELAQLPVRIQELLGKIKSFQKNDGSYASSVKFSPLDETRLALFSINLLEDLVQDMIFYYSVPRLDPIRKIYQNVDDLMKTYNLIKEASSEAKEKP